MTFLFFFSKKKLTKLVDLLYHDDAQLSNAYLTILFYCILNHKIHKHRVFPQYESKCVFSYDHDANFSYNKMDTCRLVFQDELNQ